MDATNMLSLLCYNVYPQDLRAPMPEPAGIIYSGELEKCPIFRYGVHLSLPVTIPFLACGWQYDA
jgi:hypothetical protein